MNLTPDISLLPYNTFHMDEKAERFIEIKDQAELTAFLDFARRENKEIAILGGGSNILLTKPVRKLVMLNRIKGIELVEESNADIKVKFMSGENWHQCVLWCVDRGLGGIENLSLIPGTVGAAPIQNIGAYGVELKDVFEQLEGIDIETGEKNVFLKDDCAFGYRDSIFKHNSSKYFILSVTLRLQKFPKINIAYGDLEKVLQNDFEGEVNVKNISDAVIKIRQSKLPDPNEIGNAGSFFKNPVVTKEHAESLKNIFNGMPVFEVADGCKIPAGWLIEQCNWKGFKEDEYGVHDRQALVLVNYGNASGTDIASLAARIITSVQQRFNIALQTEVNIW